MMRLLTGFAVAGSMLALLPAPIAPAASNTATTLFPLDGPNQLETHAFLNCFKGDGHCDFTVGADTRTPDGVSGFPPGLWARQTTEIRQTTQIRQATQIRQTAALTTQHIQVHDVRGQSTRITSGSNLLEVQPCPVIGVFKKDLVCARRQDAVEVHVLRPDEKFGPARPIPIGT